VGIVSVQSPNNALEFCLVLDFLPKRNAGVRPGERETDSIDIAYPSRQRCSKRFAVDVSSGLGI